MPNDGQRHARPGQPTTPNQPIAVRAPAAGEDDPYDALRQTEARIANRLIRFSDDRFGDEHQLRALEEFDPECEEPEIDENEFQHFLPWFLFNWRDPSLAASSPQRADSHAPSIAGPAGESISTSSGAPTSTDAPAGAATQTGAAPQTAGAAPTRAAAPSHTDAPTVSGAPTIAEIYLEARGNRAKASDRAFIERTVAQPFSFHEVIHSEPGRGMWLKDIFRGTEHEVTERTASLLARRGDILFARVVPFETCAMLVGLGATPLPPIEKLAVLALRKNLRTAHGEISNDLLHAESLALRLLYLEVRDRLWNPPPLEVYNTDGDPILIQTLTYEVESADAAFRALRPLSGRAKSKELLKGAEFDEDGRLNLIEFTWTKRGDGGRRRKQNTILGYLEIDGRTLTVEVNSAGRSRRIQAVIRKRLGDSARLINTETTTPEALAAEHDAEAEQNAERDPATIRSARRKPAREPGRASPGQLHPSTCDTLPEAQAAARRFTEAHYDSWPDQKISALGGLTPREAVGDPEGREMVEALLLDFERNSAPLVPGPAAYDFERLRKRLGLTTATRRGPR